VVTREKAIEAMDLLVSKGYSVALAASNMGDYVLPDGTSVNYSVSILGLSLDKVDLRALVEIADELDLDVGYTPVRDGAGISFGDPDRTPEVVRKPRRHPR
jgi:hypothetical protein